MIRILPAPYQRLVNKRKQCTLCRELSNPSDPSHAEYDSDAIGPWSRWQGKIPATLMVVGQDWGDVTYYRSHRGSDQSEGNPTNENLASLLASIGLDPGKPDRPTHAPLFFTNLILCLKQDGGLQGGVHESWFTNCVGNFFEALVAIVQPKAIVGLGIHANRAILECYGVRRRSTTLKTLVDDGPILLGDESRVLFPVYHCGARGVNMNRPLHLQRADWKRIGMWLNKTHPRRS